MAPKLKLDRKNNFIWLTAALFILIILGALTDEMPNVTALYFLEYVNLGLLLMALMSLRDDKSWARGLLFVVICMFIIVAAKQRLYSTVLDLALLSFLLSFYLIAIWLVGRKVLLTGTVDLNTLVGSVALYLLLGMFFSACYATLIQLSPEAIHGIARRTPIENLPETMYFSFVTLTTLGYGDMSPATPIAKALVIVEAVTGMFYLAMIVANLVGAMRARQE